VHADKRSGTFSIEIEVSNVKFPSGSFEPFAGIRINRTGKPKFRIICYFKCVIIIAGLDDSQDRCKNLFPLYCIAGLYIFDYRRLDEISGRVIAGPA